MTLGTKKRVTRVVYGVLLVVLIFFPQIVRLYDTEAVDIWYSNAHQPNDSARSLVGIDCHDRPIHVSTLYTNWADSVTVWRSDSGLIMEYTSEFAATNSTLDDLLWSIGTAETEPFHMEADRMFGYSMKFYRLGHNSRKAARLVVDHSIQCSLLDPTSCIAKVPSSKLIEFRSSDDVLVCSFHFYAPHDVTIGKAERGSSRSVRIIACKTDSY